MNKITKYFDGKAIVSTIVALMVYNAFATQLTNLTNSLKTSVGLS
jgi:hypothetical protein